MEAVCAVLVPTCTHELCGSISFSVSTLSVGSKEKALRTKKALNCSNGTAGNHGNQRTDKAQRTKLISFDFVNILVITNSKESLVHFAVSAAFFGSYGYLWLHHCGSGPWSKKGKTAVSTLKLLTLLCKRMQEFCKTDSSPMQCIYIWVRIGLRDSVANQLAFKWRKHRNWTHCATEEPSFTQENCHMKTF